MLDSKSLLVQEISMKEFILQIKYWYKYFTKNWLFISIMSLSGALIGLLFVFSKPINYSAKITFILEEGKSNASGLGNLMSLAGQFGVDVGSSSGGSILSGDNILLYFKSPALAKEVLLTRFDSTTNESIADVYIKKHVKYKEWSKNDVIGKLKFNLDEASNSRLHDSLLQKITQNILENQFKVNRVDKKAGFIEVLISTEDEQLSKKYCERIVARVVERYINIKVERQKLTVEKLQQRADSISFLLRQKTFSGASLQNNSNIMDINPLYKTNTTVAVETTLRDKTLLSTIFASVIQNLEMAKFTLSQETPVIQIIDYPVYPLKKEKYSKVVSIFTGFIVFLIISLIYLVLRKFFSRLS